MTSRIYRKQKRKVFLPTSFQKEVGEITLQNRICVLQYISVHKRT